MSREKLAERIIDIAWTSTQAYPFGGYIRSLIASKDFAGIDLFFCRKDLTDVFVNTILLNNCSILPPPCQGQELTLLGVKKNDFHIQESAGFGSVIAVSCFYEIETVAASPIPFRRGVDVDINYLYMEPSSGDICAAPWIDLELAKKHILNQEFTAESTVSRDKIDKMIARGYKWLNPFDAPSTVSENKIIPVCSKCNGTGELDFGFYKRACGCKLI